MRWRKQSIVPETIILIFRPRGTPHSAVKFLVKFDLAWREWILSTILSLNPLCLGKVSANIHNQDDIWPLDFDWSVHMLLKERSSLNPVRSYSYEERAPFFFFLCKKKKRAPFCTVTNSSSRRKHSVVDHLVTSSLALLRRNVRCPLWHHHPWTSVHTPLRACTR